MPVNLPSQVIVGRYQVTYKGVDLGYTDEVVVGRRVRTQEKTVAQTFGQPLGHVVMGVDIIIKMVLKEVIKVNLGVAFPWWNGSGAITLCPPTLGVDLYDSAGALVIHPMEVGDTTADWNVTKAAAVGESVVKRDGQGFVTLPLEFAAYPDRASLPNIVLGTFGT